MIKCLTQIEKLRPEFELGGGMRMVDWFKVEKRHRLVSITSGLRHADGKTLSPFHYDRLHFGAYATRDALREFNAWWLQKQLDHEHIKKVYK